MRLAPVLVVEETGNGAKAGLPGLLRVMDAARRGDVQAVPVRKLDRLGRSALDLARHVDELRRAGVRLVAVTQGIDLAPDHPDAAAKMATRHARNRAEYERALIVGRTRAGLDRARRKGTKSGKPIGRPRAPPILLHAARDLVAAAVPVADAAQRKGVARSTPRRFLAGATASPC